MERAQALRQLIAAFEPGDLMVSGPVTVAVGFREAADFWAAEGGSLDAVARLESPLRDRRWQSRVDDFVDYWRADWWAAPYDRPKPTVTASAPTEPRARLLAVLRALLHEAEHPTP